MDRTILYSQEQARTFDFISFEHDVLKALAFAMQDTLGANAATTTVISGGAATQTGPATLTINIAASRVYQQTSADAVAVGGIAQDLSVIEQQGFYAGAQITLSTAGISAGQSRWSLVEAQFSQSDIVRSGDPNAGVPPFYNAANPASPLNGQGGLGNVSPTERTGLCILQVITGAAATTGSEVPPTATGGWIPLFLIDLTFGQTAITTAQILTSGPSVGTNVPSNYPYAPFLAGLLSSHHSGNPGQAPKVNLASEVQGLLPASQVGLVVSGQCRLSVTSTTVLTLAPLYGNTLRVNGQNVSLPSGGITITNAGLTAATAYYAYCFLNSGTPTLEISTTGHVTSTSDGTEIKSGDATRALVGFIYTGAGTPGTFVDSVTFRGCLNWFNRRNLPLLISPISGSTTNGAFTPMGSLATFLSWGDEALMLSLTGSVQNSTTSDGVNVGINVDNTQTGSISTLTSSSAGFSGSAAAAALLTPTEGAHTTQAVMLAFTGGTANIASAALAGTLRG